MGDMSHKQNVPKKEDQCWKYKNTSSDNQDIGHVQFFERNLIDLDDPIELDTNLRDRD